LCWNFWSYQLHKCRDELNLKTLAIEEGSDIEGLGIGIDIQVHDVTLKVILMAIPFQKKFIKIGLGKKNIQNKIQFLNI